MSGPTVENIAILAAFASLIVGGAVYALWHIARFIDDQRWLRARRKMRTERNMIPVQPRVNRHSNRRTREPR